MEYLTLDGPPPLQVLLKRSRRARRMSLRISQIKGTVSMTVPHFVDQKTAIAFAKEKESWLRKHMSERQQDVLVGFGATIPFEGQSFQVRQGDVRRVVAKDGVLLCPAGAAMVQARVAAFLKLRARERLVAATQTYASVLGRPFGRITLRDTISRWGSCSSQGNLNYSWRLIMAPPEVLNYVAAHEVAHLQEMNHSAAFWAVVDRLYPDQLTQRAWLREHGSGLHQYRFD